MITRSGTQPLRGGPTRRWRWRRLIYLPLLAGAATLLFASSFALAYTAAHEGQVVPGVDVAGVELGGLERPAAEARLRAVLPSLAAGRLALRLGDREVSIPYADFERDYDIELTLERALAVGRGGDPFTEARRHLGVLLGGVSIEPSMRWDSAKLALRVRAAVAGAQVRPLDAGVVFDQGGYGVVPARHGLSFDSDEIVGLAAAAVDNLSGADTTVAVAPRVVPSFVSTAQAQAAVDRYARVAGNALLLRGVGSTTFIEAEVISGWLSLEESTAGSWALTIDRAPIVELVEELAAEIQREPVDASFAFAGAEVVVVADIDGLAVDVEASVSAIIAALEARSYGVGPAAVGLALAVVTPDFGTEEAQAVVPRVERLSRWRTNYVPGVMNYDGRNITIPTDRIDGTVLAPGQTFDFWEVVGEPTVGDGYGPGGAIIRGRTVPDGALAGGICSVSTTIFNAALRAGLDMGVRKNHFYYINRYPVGLDATVWISNSGRQLSLTFTNDMEYPVLIRGINRRKAVIFEIWGVPDGRTVSLSEPRVDNRKPAYELLRYTDRLPAGRRQRIEYPAAGYESWVTRTVRTAEGAMLHEDSYYSKYARIPGITLVGRRAGDPPHGTEVRLGRGGVN
jgi:vancomycin resistance protein YoaR